MRNVETATSVSVFSFPRKTMAYEELQVPGEPGVWFCARHKGVQTRLRCGRCEKPICPRCTVMGPTGARCRECASNRDSHMYQVAPAQMALALGASAVLGAVGAQLSQLAGAYWFWVLLYAPAVGPVWGRAITRITGGKRGGKIALVVSLGLVIGALLSVLGAGWLLHGRAGSLAWPWLALGHLPLWIFLALAIAGVWWWLK